MHPQLQLLQLYTQLRGQAFDSAQLQHQCAPLFEESDTPPLGRVLRALQQMGFDARARRGTPEQALAAALPALMLAQGDLLMVAGWKTDTDSVSAPSEVETAVGQVVVQVEGQAEAKLLDIAGFGRLYAGQWIEAVPTAQAKATLDSDSATQKFGLSWFWRSLSRYKGLMVEVLLASLFVQIIALITPLIFQVVIDKVLTNRTLSTLDVMVVALLGVSVFEVVLGAMRHYLLSHTTNRIDVELGARLFRHLLHLPLTYFESRRSGDTVARVRELDNARNFLTGQALTSWLDLAFALVYLAVMLYYSVALTLVVLAALPVFFFASAIVTPFLRRKLEDKFALGADNQAYLVETVTSMETLKSHAVEPRWQGDWERRLSSYVKTAFEGGHMANATNQFIGLASKIMTVLLLWLGARLVIEGDLTVGGLIAFNMLSGRVNAPILKLSSLWQDWTQMKVSIRRLGEIMDAQPEPIFRLGRSSPPALQGAVVFEHVNFRYGPKAPQVLMDLSFTVRPGEVIGVVGVSGAGKTTLMRLLQRLYTPESGRILVDGVDLNLVDASWLRRQLGVVGQDTLLFNRSVRDNIALANPAMGMDRVMDAARLAGGHDFILQLPDGYDTVVGERGSRLSGGQRARIAIARALVSNPRILLLDEATAALDYESERVVHDNMSAIARNRTVFIVAHRLSTLRLADRILVLENGRLVETGQHTELLHAGGRYAALYKAHQVLDGDPPAAGVANYLGKAMKVSA